MRDGDGATEADALGFIDEVGFCWLFPQRDRPLPSLWQHLKGPGAVMDDWDEDATRMWGWKDDFPRRGLAYYGKLVGRRPTFVSVAVLPCFLAVRGRGDDLEDCRRFFDDGLLTPEARDIVAHVSEVGPVPASELRRRFGSRARPGRVDRALDDLQVALLLTHCGIQERGGAWPGVVYDLVGRVFPGALATARDCDSGHARRAILGCYRKRFPTVDARSVARLLGWSLRDVETADSALFRS